MTDEEIQTIADRVIEAMSKPIGVQGREIQQAASIGIALFSAEAEHWGT